MTMLVCAVLGRYVNEINHLQIFPRPSVLFWQCTLTRVNMLWCMQRRLKKSEWGSLHEFDQIACVWSAGAVSAARLSHTGTMRRTTGSSVRRTTGLNLGSCVMAARSPSPPDSSWWVQTVRNPISAVSVLRFLQLHHSPPFTQSLLP